MKHMIKGLKHAEQDKFVFQTRDDAMGFNKQIVFLMSTILNCVLSEIKVEVGNHMGIVVGGGSFVIESM